MACAIKTYGSESASSIADRVICMVKADVGNATAITGSTMHLRLPTRLELIGTYEIW